VSEATRWPETRARYGAVASPHTLASDAGVAILRAGGNAVDAAIAAAATLAVVYPHMNGVGGDNFWLVYDAGRQRLRALNGAGRAALAADLDGYRQRFGTAIQMG
jgi:gamma-glutamyltranspeptidase/glutathione hydrolase